MSRYEIQVYGSGGVEGHAVWRQLADGPRVGSRYQARPASTSFALPQRGALAALGPCVSLMTWAGALNRVPAIFGERRARSDSNGRCSWAAYAACVMPIGASPSGMGNPATFLVKAREGAASARLAAACAT